MPLKAKRKELKHFVTERMEGLKRIPVQKESTVRQAFQH